MEPFCYYEATKKNFSMNNLKPKTHTARVVIEAFKTEIENQIGKKITYKDFLNIKILNLQLTIV